ncbi:MAG: DUF4270 domain-containing protein [Carboxylicivirga sp.]|jgi:hypothetical protein|nr:DUF4270 domain-containing protein [Carboxylicivirga sp.]
MKKFSFKNILTTTTGQFFIIGLLCIGYACEDEPAQLSGNILPPGERINGITYDEHILDTRNILRTNNDNKVQTNHADLGIIGEFNDPKFGKTKADFVTNFNIAGKPSFSVSTVKVEGNDTIRNTETFHRFNNNKDDIADNWKVDSLVLSLQYQFNGWYGDMLSKQRVKVYELSNGLGSPLVDQFNDYEVAHEATALADILLHPNIDIPDTLRNATNWSNIWAYPDSLWNHPQYLWNQDKVKQAIDSAWVSNSYNAHTAKTKNWTIKLNDDIAERFFLFEESELASKAAFESAFNGLYVTSEQENSGNEGWLAQVNLLGTSNSVASNLRIYLSREHKYENAQKEIRDTVTNYTYTFPINSENVRINRFAHTTTDDIKVDDATTNRLYIQGMAGSYMRLMFPEEIMQWTDSIKDPQAENADLSKPFNIASNIELLMEIDSTTTDMSRYPIPENLSILWKNDKGELEVPTFVFTNNGQTTTRPVFGITSSNGSIGGGERVIELNDDGSRQYYYRFIMNADYFNDIMKDGGDNLDQKEFYLLPNNLRNSTYNINRVILFSGAEANMKLNIGGKEVDKRMKLDIKYFKYKVR